MSDMVIVLLPLNNHLLEKMVVTKAGAEAVAKAAMVVVEKEDHLPQEETKAEATKDVVLLAEAMTENPTTEEVTTEEVVEKEKNGTKMLLRAVVSIKMQAVVLQENQITGIKKNQKIVLPENQMAVLKKIRIQASIKEIQKIQAEPVDPAKRDGKLLNLSL